MVAVMHASGSLRNCLNYNEQKVKSGDAKCLEAGNYPMDAADMNFYQKLARLENLAALNQRTKVNSVHFSLNFHPDEKLSEALLKEIAEVFLDKVGFAGQPYLLYQHFDAGHPHIHLVTTNIKPDGKAINLNNMGRNQAQAARREIEIGYGLMQADKVQEREVYNLKPVNVQRALYGRMETKRAIAGVLSSVIKNYKFNSLPQLNAVLGLYNITADPGSEGSRIREHEGLVYRVLDEQGNKVGVPIRASDFFDKPTLKKLQQKFIEKEAQKLPEHRGRIRQTIDLELLRGRMDLQELAARLKSSGIDMVIRQNAEGLIYGVTYVDHVKKTVFNGSELGKEYSAKAMLERCANTEGRGERNRAGEAKKVRPGKASGHGRGGVNKPEYFTGERENNSGFGLAEALLDPGDQREAMDWQLKLSKRKKKRRRLSQD
ncbi:relaxase/mobilization nuclease domain-containing protein [Mucilaginibacter angelicae]|uniref:Relaxase/mobilization nuclease domain-containing protein n=1 Tax=Mucilaginibacter angelicae TaxID=869718 RepID=A0ABV6L2D7_9SPHI